MTREAAIDILLRMLGGCDPLTGRPLPGDHVLRQAPVVHALHQAVQALEGGNAPINKNGRLNAGRPWTRQDLDQLAQLFAGGSSIDQICSRLQRRPRGVINQLESLGLMDQGGKALRSGQENARTRWNVEDDGDLRAMFAQRLAVKDMARRLRRSPYAIFCRMEKLGLYGEAPGYPADEGGAQWRNEDTRQLRYLAAQGNTAPELARYFGCSEKSIALRMDYLGLQIGPTEGPPSDG